MSQTIHIVDAFADQPFKGNPAAVCVLPKPADEIWMQSLAQEMNLSETAFLDPREDGYNLRWFAPSAEVDLCGHATLASAHVLWDEGHVAADGECRFHTRSSWLTARRENSIITIALPRESAERIDLPPGLSEALGIPIAAAFHNRLAFILTEAEDEDTVRNLTPDFGLLRQLPYHGYIVTSRAETPGVDVVSRFFAPSLGINEDPVTGAAHCVLGPYWHERLGKSTFTAHQASPRGGVIQVTVREDAVHLGGQALTICRGILDPAAMPSPAPKEVTR